MNFRQIPTSGLPPLLVAVCELPADLHDDAHDGPEVVGVLAGPQPVQCHGCMLLLLVVPQTHVGHEQ